MIGLRARTQVDGSQNGTNARGSVSGRIRWWVFLIGVLLIPVNSLWIARAEALDYSGFPTNASLFYNVIFCLLVLILLNGAVRYFRPAAALSQIELLILYGMLVTSSSLVGHDTMQMLVPSITHGEYFASTSNNWNHLITPYLPHWLTIPSPQEAVTTYELGHSTLYTWNHLRVWAIPVLAWSVFLLSILFTQLSINVLLRKQWVENERLSYPVVQIPMLITQNGGATKLFASRLFWAGFALSAAIDIMNGLHQFYPLLPFLNVKVNDLTPYLTSRPWSGMGWTQVSFYPWVIGLSYFMPTNMAFSCWFFFMFRKAQQVLAVALGYTGTDIWYPYVKEQAFGALAALVVGSLWMSRRYIADIWRQAFSRGRMSGGEGATYRKAWLALIAFTLVGIGFLTAAGLSLIWAASYVVLYLIFTTGLTRLRAEVGPPDHQFAYVGPSHILILALGTTVLGPKNLTIFTLLWFQNRMHRGILMPQQAESLKAATQAGMKMSKMIFALAFAGVLGVFSAFWAMLSISYARTYPAAYHPGAPGSGFPQEAFMTLASYLTNPVGRDLTGLTAIGLGAAFALVLQRMTVLFYGFPFHPAGYAVGMAFGLDMVWGPILISWLIKVLILRYKGLAGFRAGIPFFVGLIIGEFVVGGMWSFLRGVLGIQTYTFYY